MLILNLFVLLLCCWVLMSGNIRMRERHIFERFRFKIFALRDTLALAAMSGKIPQESKEYSYICKMINSLLVNVETHDPVAVVRAVLALKNDKQLEKHVMNVSEAIGDDKYECIREIRTDFFKISREIFRYNTKWLLVGAAVITFVTASRPPKKVQEWEHKCKDARSYLEEQVA